MALPSIKSSTQIIGGVVNSPINVSIDTNMITTASVYLSNLTPGKMYLLDTSMNGIEINCDLSSTDDIGKQWTFVLVDASNTVEFRTQGATPVSTLPDHYASIVTSSYATVTATQIEDTKVIVQGSLQPI